MKTKRIFRVTKEFLADIDIAGQYHKMMADMLGRSAEWLKACKLEGFEEAAKSLNKQDTLKLKLLSNTGILYKNLAYNKFRLAHIEKHPEFAGSVEMEYVPEKMHIKVIFEEDILKKAKDIIDTLFG